MIFIDTETYSTVDIKKHGVYRYFEADATEVLITTYAIDNGPVACIDHTSSEVLPSCLYEYQGVFAAHNATFDQFALALVGLDIPDSRLVDTAALARAAGLPGDLSGACKAAGVPTEKQKLSGSKLIQRFCKPAPINHKAHRYTRETHPEEWAAFKEYATLDVVAMRELFHRLPGANDL